MLDRASCERRVYRLATLLTGNPDAATRVIEAVVGVQPDLRRLDSAHIDRLTVLRCREAPRGAMKGQRLPEKLVDALSLLSAQQREAWIFSHVYRLDLRDMARAMDCSVKAVEMHVSSAGGLMTPLVPDAASAGKAMLAYSMQLEVPAFYRSRIDRKRRVRLVRRLVLVVIVLAAFGGVVWLFQSDRIETWLGWGPPPP